MSTTLIVGLGLCLLVIVVAGVMFCAFALSARADEDDIDWEP